MNILKKEIANTDESRISQEIKKYFSLYDLKANNCETMKYELEYIASDKLIEFLKSFEKQKSDFGIESYEIHSSSMEDVFLRYI